MRLQDPHGIAQSELERCQVGIDEAHGSWVPDPQPGVGRAPPSRRTDLPSEARIRGTEWLTVELPARPTPDQPLPQVAHDEGGRSCRPASSPASPEGQLPSCVQTPTTKEPIGGHLPCSASAPLHEAANARRRHSGRRLHTRVRSTPRVAECRVRRCTSRLASPRHDAQTPSVQLVSSHRQLQSSPELPFARSRAW